MNITSEYAQLPEEFYEQIRPSAAVEPELIAYNQTLANKLGLDFNTDEILAYFSGEKDIPHATPLAMAYAGQQYGNFVPQLGDGRAVLIADVMAPNGQVYDLHLKGAGRTKFSRGGDGRSALGPVIREYIVSEAMHNLGVPTTRSLCAVTSGEDVYREDAVAGGIFTRVASSHIRIGTYQYFAARQMKEHLIALANFSIKRHYPSVEEGDYFELLKKICERQINLVARWMGLGFIHGVMNTDNTTISGETIDFGPCAFMDDYQADKVYSSIDRHGRYAYNNQGNIICWNLSQLAQCFVTLIDSDENSAVDKLNTYLETLPNKYQTQWLKVMGKKFGILNTKESDKAIIEEFLNVLEDENYDFTNSFRNLSHWKFFDVEFMNKLAKVYEDRGIDKEQAMNLMKSVNPARIPRNHQLEKAIQLSYKKDYSRFAKLMHALANPYEDMPEYSFLTEPPTEEEKVTKTFCGT